MSESSVGSQVVDKSKLYLGLDVGSVSLDTVVLDSEGQILLAQYTRTKGRPLAVATQVLTEVLERFGRESFAAVAVTGSGAPTLAPLLGGEVVNEIIAAARGVQRLCPQAHTIIDMGGEDAKMVLVSPGPDGGLRIEDFAMNTMCAAGTGSFLDQQSHRLQLTIEQFSEIAMNSANPPRLAGRCSVFAKSDMIHLQQEATPDYDIVAGLCFAMARNLKSNIAKGKKVVPPVAFIGGVAANQGVHRALKEILDLEDGELLVPPDFGCVGALGAALFAQDKGLVAPLSGLEDLQRRAAEAAGETKRLPRLQLGDHHRKDLQKIQVPEGQLVGYLGVDVGSISTNVVVIDEQGNVLSKQYLLTAGRPLEAVKEGLRLAGAEIGDRVTILGAGTTGSGRYLTADFIGADIVRNEITAQATAAAHIDPEVDTIFEIGGQDSKYISLENGAIVDFMMNKVCAAGTGSFLEEQAEKLGIQIKGEFGSKALEAPNPVRMGERCTVFMESDLVSHQASGAEIDDLVAGLSYSIVHNYLNKVVEDRKIGKRIFYQGATAANHGIVAAFEAVTGRPIIVPPHHDVTGAIGAALLSMRERTWKQSSFKGFAVSETGYEITTFECSGCPNTCSIRKVKVEGLAKPLFYGSRCEKYDVDRDSQVREDIPDLFAEREELLLSYAGPVDPQRKKGLIGIPRTMFFREWLPFFSAFLNRLGFEVQVSGPSTKRLIHKGVEAVVNEPCFPVKVAHGHLAELIESGVEKILLPSLINLPAPGNELTYGQVCPYAQTLCYTAPAALDFGGSELIDTPLRFGYDAGTMRSDLKALAKRLGAGTRGLSQAIAAGWEAQHDFNRRLVARGKEVLASMKPGDRAMVVISRPYNGADPGLNLGIPQKMRHLGVFSIPMDFLDLDQHMGHSELAEMYWRYGQKILASALQVRSDPRLHAVYITNFGCGPDSFIGHFFRRIMEGKPFLEIEIDEHSADVGAITRLEAFLDSLGNVITTPPQAKPARRRDIKPGKRTIYIPPMTDHSVAVAAAFAACGGHAEVLPESDQRTLELGRRYTSGKECYPCALTTGDLLKLLMDEKVPAKDVAFFMPGGTGPCRFGQYHRYHRLILDELGFEEARIYSPDQSEVFYKELGMVGGSDFTRLAWQGVVAVDLLMKALHETRPYEAVPGDSDEVYRHCLARVAEVMGRKGDLKAVMAEARGEFAAVRRSGDNHRPLVGVVGEIYTRANRFANEDIVRTVEALGGEAWTPTIGEWVLYTNFTSAVRAKMLKRRQALVGTLLENYFQHKDERNLAKPWSGSLKTLHEPEVKEVLKMAHPYLEPSFEGEAILSLGKSRDMLSRGASGVINVIPFTCMPGTIVNALMKRFREDHGNLPFLPMAMDGQEQSGSRIRLEAFMHQVRQFQQAHEN
ncbi:MAG: acyl-CoA dehydratase activase [Desulfarculaceae bacterium]|nr:acyl-CoA dehydratase activase [Desulfarculaceae bacterium]